MNIVYASDDGYCRHMAVSIYSVIDHNRGEDLQFHILSDGISPENLHRLEDVISSAGKTMHVYPLGDLEKRLKLRISGLDTGRFRITTLARLLVGSILPETVTRCLYIDCDTVILRPLRGLYRCDLSGMAAAMAPEPTIYPAVKELLELPAEAPYYNAGVLLVDLVGWREEQLEEQCFDYYRRMGGRLPFNDQDILNHVLAGRIRTLKQTCNFFSNFYWYRFSTLLNMAPWYGLMENAASFRQAKHHPVIVHFAGDERPWLRGSRNHYRLAYNRYLRETPFADCRSIPGKELYMQAYHWMNLLTFLCPGFRRWLSERYYENHIRKK